MGGYHFAQFIARDVPATERPAVAQAWMTRLRNAIRTSDTIHLVSLGSYPFDDGYFGPINQAHVLDALSVHLYPTGDDWQSQVELAAAYGSEACRCT